MPKNAISFAVLMLPFVFSTGYGEKNGVKGRVVDEYSKPIKNAEVKLIIANKTQTTDSAGNFFIEMPAAHILQADPVFNTITFNNGILSFNVFEIVPKIQIEVFDIKGQRVNKVLHERIVQGKYSMDLLPDVLPISMYFVKLQIGDRSSVFNVVSLKGRTCSLPGNGPGLEKPILKRFSSMSNFLDTLSVSKNNFQSTQKAIASYSATVPDIVLKGNELPPITDGTSAKTTRYWDCCKPACGWGTNLRTCDINGKDLNNAGAQSGCSGGPAYQCWDGAPIEINSKVSYGWAAINNLSTGRPACGDCFQIAFQGSLSGKQMIVQAINIGDGGDQAFDLLIPGGGAGALNGCKNQWGNVDMGVQYGGFRAKCGADRACILNMCQNAFGNKPDLMRGCNWYLDWFLMGDNPPIIYKKVPCPQEIKNISKIGN
jgi:hypothetical protein